MAHLPHTLTHTHIITCIYAHKHYHTQSCDTHTNTITHTITCIHTFKHTNTYQYALSHTQQYMLTLKCSHTHCHSHAGTHLHSGNHKHPHSNTLTFIRNNGHILIHTVINTLTSNKHTHTFSQLQPLSHKLRHTHALRKVRKHLHTHSQSTYMGHTYLFTHTHFHKHLPKSTYSQKLPQAHTCVYILFPTHFPTTGMIFILSLTCHTSH